MTSMQLTSEEDKGSPYHWLQLAEWTTADGQQLALYRVLMVARTVQQQMQAGKDLPVFCIAKAGLINTFPSADSAEVSLSIWCNPTKLQISQRTSDSKETLLLGSDCSTYIFQFTKLLDRCLDATNAQPNSLVYEAKNQIVADLVIVK